MDKQIKVCFLCSQPIIKSEYNEHILTCESDPWSTLPFPDQSHAIDDDTAENDKTDYSKGKVATPTKVKLSRHWSCHEFSFRNDRWTAQEKIMLNLPNQLTNQNSKTMHLPMQVHHQAPHLCQINHTEVSMLLMKASQDARNQEVQHILQK
jgi:hypothetical protein